MDISVENVNIFKQISDFQSVTNLNIWPLLRLILELSKYCLELGHCSIFYFVTKLQAKEFRKIVIPFLKSSFWFSSLEILASIFCNQKCIQSWYHCFHCHYLYYSIQHYSPISEEHFKSSAYNLLCKNERIVCWVVGTIIEEVNYWFFFFPKSFSN